MTPRQARLAVIASYALLSAVPFAPYLFGKTIDNPLWVLGVEGVVWLAVWALFRRPARFHWLLLPAFILLPADVYLYLFYESGVSARHLAILVETSQWEVAEFFGWKIWLMAPSALFFLAWWWAVRRAALKATALDWTGPTRQAALLALAVMALVCVASGKPFSSLQSPFDRIELSDTRPFGFFAAAAEYGAELHRLSNLQEATHSFRFEAYQPHPEKTLTVVVVLGESSRYDRWSLNGYAHETNPLLRKEKNLLTAPDIITSASATLLSLPVILSRRRALQTFKTGFSEKSFITAFRESGFKSWWFSNQIPFGELDTPVSVFAREADVVRFMNLGSFSAVSSLDEILLQPLGEALAGAEPKKLIIIHTLGNHWNYSRRYSHEFERWTPSLTGMVDLDHTDIRIKTSVNNSYDNSVLYTDWFLSRVIKTLKSSGSSSVMLYISDHGENLHDGNCDYVLHGHNSTADFHVPMVVWYSDSYGALWPEKVKQLRRHISDHLSTENIFHSLLDIADIHYPSETPEWSILNGRFRPHKRYVDSYGWADYDHANTGGVCHEVIDKGTPLPRSAGHI